MSYVPLTPPGGGYLPYWLLLTSAAATYNAVQNYIISWQTKEIYALKPHEVTPLSARTFAAWTFLSAVVRGVAAYNITDPTLYNLVVGTYLIVNGHFFSELLVYKTVKLNRASASVFIFAVISLIWTISQRGYYLSL